MYAREVAETAARPRGQRATGLERTRPTTWHATLPALGTLSCAKEERQTHNHTVSMDPTVPYAVALQEKVLEGWS